MKQKVHGVGCSICGIMLVLKKFPIWEYFSFMDAQPVYIFIYIYMHMYTYTHTHTHVYKSSRTHTHAPTFKVEVLHYDPSSIP